MPIELERRNDTGDTVTQDELSTVNPTVLKTLTPQAQPTLEHDTQVAPLKEFLSDENEWHYFALGICLTVAMIFFVLILAGVIR